MKKYLILALIIVMLVLSFLFIPGLQNLDINPFQKQSLTVTSLECIKTVKISQFRSSRYSYKALFPFDFICGDPDWSTLLYKKGSLLSPEDIENKNFYYMCKNIGIDLNRDKYFFIITTQAVAGFNIKEYLEEPILLADEETGLLKLKAPKSEILSLEVQDSYQGEDFPDIEITPGQWKDLITLLLPLVQEEIVNRGLIESADESNRAFLEKLFISTGWDSVEFK